MEDSAAQAPPRVAQQEMKNEASDQLDLPSALEARASDCKTTAEWTSLGTLRLQLADTGTASVAPMSAEFYAAKLTLKERERADRSCRPWRVRWHDRCTIISRPHIYGSYK